MVTLDNREEFRQLVAQRRRDFRIGWRYEARNSIALTEIDRERQSRLQDIVNRRRRGHLNPRAAFNVVVGLLR